MISGYVPGEKISRPIAFLLLANGAVFLLDYFTRYAYFARWLGLLPSPVLEHFQLWRLLTYTFINIPDAYFLSIIINLLLIWMLGSQIASVLGTRKFFLFYFFCAFGGGLFTLAFSALGVGGGMVSSGMAAPIFGLFVALARFFPDSEIVIFYFFPMKARYAVFVLAAVELLLIAGLGVSNAVASLCGGIFGWAFLRWDLGEFSLVDHFREKQERHREQQAEQETNRMREAMEDIDPILEKIGKQGIQSLTPDEKRTLDRVSEMKRRQKSNIVPFRRPGT